MAHKDSIHLPWLTRGWGSNPDHIDEGFSCGHSWIQDHESGYSTALSYMGISGFLGNRLQSIINQTYLKIGLCAFRKVLGSQPDIHVHFFLCVSCCTGILRSTLGSHSRNLAFVFWKCQLYCSSNRNKRETASLPGRFFSAIPAESLAFLPLTCLPPQLYEKRTLSGRDPNQIWNMVSTISYHFYQEVLSLEDFGLLRTSSFERQNILSFDDLKSLFTFSWKEGREKWNSSGKVIVHLCHALSCWAP